MAVPAEAGVVLAEAVVVLAEAGAVADSAAEAVAADRRGREAREEGPPSS